MVVGITHNWAGFEEDLRMILGTEFLNLVQICRKIKSIQLKCGKPLANNLSQV